MWSPDATYSVLDDGSKAASTPRSATTWTPFPALTASKAGRPPELVSTISTMVSPGPFEYRQVVSAPAPLPDETAPNPEPPIEATWSVVRSRQAATLGTGEAVALAEGLGLVDGDGGGGAPTLTPGFEIV